MKLVKDIEKDLQNEKISEKEAEEAFVKILKWIGENPNRVLIIIYSKLNNFLDKATRFSLVP